MRFPEVLVAGDSAAVEGLAKQAYHAGRMGRRAGANANRMLDGRPLRDFEAKRERFVVTFGDLTTVMVDKGEVEDHPSLAALREYVFQREMDRLDSGGRAAEKRQRKRLGGTLDSSMIGEIVSELAYSWFR